VIFLSLLLCSCKEKVSRTIEGSWSIDEVHYNEYDIRRCLLINILSFEEDFCILPITGDCDGLVEYTKEGVWSILKTDSVPLVLNITTKNRIFNGNHQVIFHKDENNKLLKMELISDSLYVLCRKGLFDYDNNMQLIDELVEMSQKNQ